MWPSVIFQAEVPRFLAEMSWHLLECKGPKNSRPCFFFWKPFQKCNWQRGGFSLQICRLCVPRMQSHFCRSQTLGLPRFPKHLACCTIHGEKMHLWPPRFILNTNSKLFTDWEIGSFYLFVCYNFLPTF